MRDMIEISGTKSEKVTLVVRPVELCEKLVEFLLTKYQLHGMWIQDGDLMTEEGDYHSTWDKVVRKATEKDIEVLGVVSTLKKLVKEKT